MLKRTLVRAEKVYRKIEEAGCLMSAVIAERLRIEHNELFYVLRKLRQEGLVEPINFGRVAFWCTSRAAAEEVFTKLVEALKKLLCGSVKYATPREALKFIAEDKEAKNLFSRHMPLRPNPATLQVVDSLMRRAFGQPIRSSCEHIYYIACKSSDHNSSIAENL
jgi:predicted transcriptional regulator